MSITLNKPPIIEAWVGLQFELSEDSPKWGEVTARQFLSPYLGELPKVQLETEKEVRIEEQSGGLPKIVDAATKLNVVRLFSKEQDRCLQLSLDKLVYNLAMPGMDYPGFDVMYKEAVGKFEAFIEFFHPRSVTSAVLYYLDLIRIPLPENDEPLELTDYFRLGFDAPEQPFGLMNEVRVQTSFDCPVDSGPLVLTFQSAPRQPDADYLGFYMEWQKSCLGFDSLDLDNIRQRLGASRDYMEECFQASLTKEAWNLFEPQTSIE